ncbi:MAG: HAD family phosphatase [Patescibacteria group bacterium]
MGNKKIKGIGFDYSGVVAGISGAQLSNAMCEILNVASEEYKRHYYSINHILNTGHVNRDDFWKLLLKRLGKTDKHAEVIQYLDRIPAHKINEGVLHVVRGLQLRGYKLGLLSNCNYTQAKNIKEKLAGHFDAVVLSSEIGFMKPSVEAYNIFFHALGVEPSQAVFIDDAEQNLIPSDELGFKPILFTGVESLQKALADFGIC